MKIGPLVITTADSANSEQLKLKRYIEDEIESFKAEYDKQHGILPESVETANKSLSYAYSTPFLSLLYHKDKKEKYTKPLGDIRTLEFWASQLPQAPQAIDYIVRNVFARGYSLKLAEGKQENPELKRKIEKFFRRANSNNRMSLVQVLKAILKQSLRVGDGYIEKVYTQDGKSLAEIYPVDAANMVVLIDEEEARRGVVVVTGYAKVERNYTEIIGSELKDIPEDAKLKIEEVIHIKADDSGDVYGHAPLEQNQELTKFIINVLNLNQKRFTNEIVHSLWVKLGPKATQIDADVFLAQYKANFLGKHNWGKPLITFGDIEVVRWELPTKEFSFQEFMNKIGLDHAPSLIGVQPSELNNADAKYANAEQGHVTTVLHTIYPWQTQIEDIVNFDLIPSLEGLKEDDDGLMPLGTYEFVLNRENVFGMYDLAEPLSRAMLRGAISPNEFRKIVDGKNLPQIDEDWANEYYVLIGKDLAVVSEEFFGGTDADETKTIDLGDGKLNQVSKKALLAKAK